jgi:hypothetical protein
VLYGEDLYEAFEYLKVSYIEFYPYLYYNILPSTLAAYIGNSRRDPSVHDTTPTLCLEHGLPHANNFFSVSYTNPSLIASVVAPYYWHWENSIEDLTLGYNTLHEYLSKEIYWENVRHTLRVPIVTYPKAQYYTSTDIWGRFPYTQI